MVERDTDSETAVLVPLYYNHGTDSGVLEAARDAGKMPVHIRALGVDDEITFLHNEVSLFGPDD